MGKEIILDKTYKQVPAGWTSQEKNIIGVTRVIDGVLHYAFDCSLRGLPLRRSWETLWLPVKQSMLLESSCSQKQ